MKKFLKAFAAVAVIGTLGVLIHNHVSETNLRDGTMQDRMSETVFDIISSER